MTVTRIPAQDRFWPKVQRTDTCWLWTASKTPDGYGHFSADRNADGTASHVFAHRWAYEHLVGPIPDDLVLDHLCRNPSCVNPAHLEPVTNRENILRGIGFAAENARKTHCPRNHELAGSNLDAGALKRGDRNCRTCAQERERVRSRTRPTRRLAPLAPDDPRHGRNSTYTNRACRCDPCTKAASAARRARARTGAAQ